MLTSKEVAEVAGEWLVRLDCVQVQIITGKAGWDQRQSMRRHRHLSSDPLRSIHLQGV